ncbi:MAG TPA: hypothetical protein VFN56_03555 [Candidatus Saccharimonadales bacterium]|nr:hypothetical protein [Candidatus Saccharimonadales bacterium]
MPKSIKVYVHKLVTGLSAYWHSSVWRRIKILVVCIIVVVFGSMYGVAEWYIHSEQNKQLQLGVSFIPDYAEYLGVNPQANMDALLAIGVRHFRLVSYWSDGEPSPGQYDFSQLDWEFQKAEAAHAHIVLTVGLRQPRWPECHPPDWINTSQPEQTWYPALKRYMAAVINRYKNSPSLESYQLENEYFLQGFGDCQDFSRQRLINEYQLVKSLDQTHPVIVGRSNNALGFPMGQPQPDEFSISMYKRVWDANVTHRYFEYPFPSWFYAFLAGTQKLFLHKDMIIGELQAEAWPPDGETILQSSLAEQSKSLNATRLSDRVTFAKNTGMRGIYLWGAEYWYYRWQIEHDPSVWNAAARIFGSD